MNWLQKIAINPSSFESRPTGTDDGGQNLAGPLGDYQTESLFKGKGPSPEFCSKCKKKFRQRITGNSEKNLLCMECNERMPFHNVVHR